MEEHLDRWAMAWDNQIGFTQGGRIEFNLLILQYIANRAYINRSQNNKTILFAMVDLKKAYDSINRKMLIHTLVKFRIDPKILDKIVGMYATDETTIKLGRQKEKIRVTVGIRQGCAISTLLFKMVTFCIIEELETKGVIYKTDGIELNSIWLADDTTLIANSVENLVKNIKILRNIALKYGLSINEKKSKVLPIRGSIPYEKIEGMEVVDQVQYLGVTVGDRGRDIFGREKAT